MKQIKFSNVNQIPKYVDFDSIAKKKYNSFAELESDVEWFNHNLKTKDLEQKFKKVQIENFMKTIRASLKREINKAILCAECYENAYKRPIDSIAVPCFENPHILLWADAQEYGFWPAKMMSFDEKDMVTVRFFGDYTDAIVHSSSCYLYSKDAPENQNGPARGDIFNIAIEVS